MESRPETPRTAEQDRAEIREVIYRIARAIDRMDWASIPALSHPDSFYDYGAYKGDAAGLIAWMSERHRNVFSSSHFIGNILIEFAGEAALAETYVNSVQKVPAPADPSQKVDVFACARYVDEFRRTAEGWRLKSRCVLIDNQLVSPSLPALPAGLNQGRRDRTDRLWSERARLGITDPGASVP